MPHLYHSGTDPTFQLWTYSSRLTLENNSGLHSSESPLPSFCFTPLQAPIYILRQATCCLLCEAIHDSLEQSWSLSAVCSNTLLPEPL